MANNRRHRNRRPARKVAFRNPKPTILIVCEGDKSEPEYFKGLSKSVQSTRVDIRIEPGCGVPESVVNAAKRIKKEAEESASREGDDNIAFDSVWCVFDFDEHPNIPKALQLAKDCGISVALSNPNFELWLLLHFRESPGMQHRDRIVEILKTFVPNYSKSVDYATYSTGYDDAVRRAKQLDESATVDGEVGRNPTTGVYKLTVEICEEDVK
jgi:hypothetical protein